jgi:hypothetical protein
VKSALYDPQGYADTVARAKRLLIQDVRFERVSRGIPGKRGAAHAF